MTEPTPEQLEIIKATCAEHGCEFLRIEDGNIIDRVKGVYEHAVFNLFSGSQSLKSLAPPTPIFDSETVRLCEDSSATGSIAGFSKRYGGRKRHGKRPKFH